MKLIFTNDDIFTLAEMIVKVQPTARVWGLKDLCNQETCLSVDLADAYAVILDRESE